MQYWQLEPVSPTCYHYQILGGPYRPMEVSTEAEFPKPQRFWQALSFLNLKGLGNFEPWASAKFPKPQRFRKL